MCARDVQDFTGELNRYATARATVRDVQAVERCRDLTEDIFGRFLQFDLRNGSIRKKFDSLKYTLKTLERTLYELSLTTAVRLEPLEVRLAMCRGTLCHMAPTIDVAMWLHEDTVSLSQSGAADYDCNDYGIQLLFHSKPFTTYSVQGAVRCATGGDSEAG